ncbi:MAG: transposase [Gemmataceae bacterium]
MVKQNGETNAGAELASLPIQQAHAAGIDIGDATHWMCVDADGGDAAVREFPAHTPGLRQLVAWLRQCGITTVALEATGAYGHVLFLTLLEAGFHVVTTSPTFTRQIKGRPKTDCRDCQWIQRLRRQRARLGAPKAITATAHKLARILYHLMRHGLAYMRKEEAAYAQQVRERLEKQLHRRAKELGYELKKIDPPLHTITMPDGEVVLVKPDGEIVNA